MLERYVVKDGKKLRYGYTTGPVQQLLQKHDGNAFFSKSLRFYRNRYS